jgi:hypothetical protein
MDSTHKNLKILIGQIILGVNNKKQILQFKKIILNIIGQILKLEKKFMIILVRDISIKIGK